MSDLDLFPPANPDYDPDPESKNETLKLCTGIRNAGDIGDVQCVVIGQ